MSKRIWIVSDIQWPFSDRKALKAVIRAIGEVQPDEVVFIGDNLDFPQPSRWTAGTRGEFEGSIFEDVKTFKERVLAPLRDVYDGPIGAHEGNHDLRPREYLAKNSPALDATNAFNIEVLCDFEGFDIELLPAFYEIAPGWLSTHGHLAKISISQIPGNSARNAAIKFGKSVAMGHTHKQGIIPHTSGYAGKVTSIVTGMEVGHLMDMRMAHYLKLATANWQLGFGILTVDGAHVQPELVGITKGRFTVDGRTWEV